MPPQNSGVQFENQGEEFGTPPQRSGGMDITGALVRAGLVSSEREAQYVLIGIGVVALVVVAYFFFSGGSHAPPPPPPHMAPAGAYQ